MLGGTCAAPKAGIALRVWALCVVCGTLLAPWASGEASSAVANSPVIGTGLDLSAFAPDQYSYGGTLDVRAASDADSQAATAAGATWVLSVYPLTGPFGSGSSKPQAFPLTGVSLVPGSYELTFSAPAGWLEPEARIIQIIGERTTSVEVPFSKAPTYYLSSGATGTKDFVFLGRARSGIPPVIARAGHKASFFVKCTEIPGAPITMEVHSSANGVPHVSPTLDGNGLFSYTPQAADWEDFTVTFSATGGGKTVSQTVPVTPIQDLPPERDLVSPPKSGDFSVDESEYVQVKTSLGLAGPRKRNTLTISGKTVNIRAGDPNGVYDLTQGIKSIATAGILIYADTVNVCDEWQVPGVFVTIRARHLNFIGPTAAIVTDELPAQSYTSHVPAIADAVPVADQPDSGPWQILTPASDGVKGFPGGNIKLRVESFSTDPMPGYESPRRFRCYGGTGQAGGQGMAGKKGRCMATPETRGYKFFDSFPQFARSLLAWWSMNGYDYTTDYFNQHLTCVMAGLPDDWHPVPFFPSIQGEDPTGTPYMPEWWPTDGGDAYPGGLGGEGGDGGLLTSNIDLRVFYESFSGSRGETPVSAGGTAGTPSPAYLLWFDVEDQYASWLSQVRTTVGGKSAQATIPQWPIQTPVYGVIEGDEGEWIHPRAVEAILQYAKDAYLNGYIDAAKRIFAEYAGLIDAFKGTYPADSKEYADLQDLQLEAQRLYDQIEAGQDYFGHPAGWVPMLSFEVTAQLFKDEIDFGMPILFSSYLINAAEATQEEKQAALDASLEKLVKEREKYNKQYAKLTDFLQNDLQNEALSIGNEITQLQTQIANYETLLSQHAQDLVDEQHSKAWFKVATRMMAGLCTVIPVGQPALGAVGVGLQAVSNVNPDSPLSSIYQQKNTFMEMGKSTQVPDAAKAVKAVLDQLEANGEGNPNSNKELLKKLYTAGDQMAKAMKPGIDALKETTASQSDVDAMLASLKSNSFEFQSMVNKLKQLNARKEIFYKQITETQQALKEVVVSMATNTATLQELTDPSQAHVNMLSPRAKAFVKDMETRTRDRLLRYEYYMAKAYEYRTLKPYPNAFDLQAVYDQILTILQEAHQPGHQLDVNAACEALKNVYRSRLRDIIFMTVDDNLVVNGQGSDSIFTLKLTQEELDALNREPYQVIVNPVQRGAFAVGEEDIRIRDLAPDKQLAGGLRGIEVQCEGENCDGVSFRISARHTGDSTVCSAGKVFRFQHYALNTRKFLSWNSKYIADLADPIQPDTPSSEDISLIKEILTLSGDSISAQSTITNGSGAEVSLYSRPSAWADLVIQLDATASGGTPFRITNLRLVGHAGESSSNNHDLVVETVGTTPLSSGGSETSVSLMPTYSVKRAGTEPNDVNGRAYGRGFFRRCYLQNDSVTVVAPLRYGTYEFDHWEIRDSQVQTQVSPQLILSMSGGKRCIAYFRNTQTYHGRIYGDFNEDHYVDDADLNKLRSEWPTLDLSGLLQNPLVFDNYSGASAYGPADFCTMLDHWHQHVP